MVRSRRVEVNKLEYQLVVCKQVVRAKVTENAHLMRELRSGYNHTFLFGSSFPERLIVAAESPSVVKVRFGPYEFDPSKGDLRKSGHALRLQPQPAKVLALLVSRPGELMLREEFEKEIWGSNTFVDFERGLNFSISQLRATLGDDPETPKYVETVPRRGYRFVAPVESRIGVRDGLSSNQAVETAGPRMQLVLPPDRRRILRFAGAIACLLIALLLVVSWVF